MDKETRWLIQDAEMERLRIQRMEAERSVDKQAKDHQSYERDVAYVRRHGRRNAAIGKIRKYTVVASVIATIGFPSVAAEDGFLKALFGAVMFVAIGAALGLYRAYHLPDA